MKFRYISIIMGLYLPLLLSCKRDQYKVNSSSVSVNIEIKRLEQDLFSTAPEDIPGIVPRLKEKFGDCLRLFSFVINAGDISDPSFGDNLTGFCTDKLNYEVYEAVMKQYPDIKSIEEDMEDAFRHYLWYFPGKKIPALFTCTTGFNNSLIVGDSVLGISLDRYLGRDSKYYPRLEIYKYMAARMNSWNIVPDCIYGWRSTEWDFETLKYTADNLLSEMLHEGKLRYFEKCMLPEISDTILFGFSSDQMEFCRNNESQMWQYLIENDLLFSTDQFIIRKFTGEAPFTSYFTNESPGRAAIWIGFRIVESYMMKNRNVGLGDLMKDTDIQGLLGKAKYSPG